MGSGPSMKMGKCSAESVVLVLQGMEASAYSSDGLYFHETPAADQVESASAMGIHAAAAVQEGFGCSWMVLLGNPQNLATLRMGLW